MSRRRLYYNDIVTVVKGRYTGVTGLYDDDMSGGRIVVCPGVWMSGDGYIIVPRRFCVKAKPVAEEIYRTHFQNDLAQRRGFNQLVALAHKQNPDDDTPVP